MTDKKSFLDHVNRKNKKETVKESFSEEKFIKTKRSSFGLVVMVFIMAVILIGFYMMVNKKVEIIDLIDLTSSEAIEWGNQNNLIISSSVEYSNEALDRVITQAISAGSKVKRGAIIKIVLSDGLNPYDKIELPNFDGLWSRSSIMVWIQEHGIINYSFSSVVSDDVEEDFLINYQLVGTTKADFNRSSEIVFVLREVIDHTAIEMPSFLGSTLLDLDIWAQNNEIKYIYEYVYNGFFEKDKITEQSIVAGQNMNKQDVLIVKVSLGLEEEPVEMINLINMKLSDAEAWLKNHHVSYHLTYKYSSAYESYKVMNQSLLLNDRVTDEILELTISLGESLKVPDFNTMTYSQAINYAAMYPNNFMVTQKYHTLDAGSLIEQSIAANKYMKSDEQVYVIYSIGQNTLVPNFKNQTAYDVKQWVDIQNNNGASIGLNISEVPSSSVSVGKVISQSNHLGEIAIDETLEVLISKGISVPNFSEMTKSQTVTYKDQNIIQVTVEERYSKEIEAGELISQSIEKETVLVDNEGLVVIYSLGDELAVAEYINEPLVLLESWVREQNALGAEITLSIEEHFANDVSYGKIITQSIFNKYVSMDETINIIVSRGESYVVPDFSHKIRLSIESIAASQNLKIAFVYVSSDKPIADLVVSQNPSPGTVISKNDVIYIELSE